MFSAMKAMTAPVAASAIRSTARGLSSKSPMQTYVVTGTIPDQKTQRLVYQDAAKYFAAGAPGDKFEGFEVVSRYHCPFARKVILVVKSADGVGLFKHFAIWSVKHNFEFNIDVAFTDDEVDSYFQDLEKQIASSE